jgi:hypothetical protein
MDIQLPSYWEGSLDVIRADIDAFVDLVDLVDRRYSAEPERAEPPV